MPRSPPNVVPPVPNDRRMARQVSEPRGNDEQIQNQINADNKDRKPQDAARESSKKDHCQTAADDQENQRDRQLLVAIGGQPCSKGVVQRSAPLMAGAGEPLQRRLPMRFGVMDQVLGGRGNGYCAREDEVRGREAKQHKDQELATPTR